MSSEQSFIAREWIEFHQQHVARGEHKDRDFWFQALSDRTEDSIAQRFSPLSKEERKNERFELRTRTVSKKELEELRKLGVISQRHIKNIDFSARDPNGSKVRTLSFQDAKPSKLFWVREYKKGQKIFPKGFRFFQSGLVLSGTNFPPLVAKYLYQRFTEDIKDQEHIIIYDPSAGFGGRLLGALSARDRSATTLRRNRSQSRQLARGRRHVALRSSCSLLPSQRSVRPIRPLRVFQAWV